MSARVSKEAKLVLGASPRVDLLPPEVADRKKGAALRRSIVIGVVGALVISAGGYAIASWQSIQAGVNLESARVETASLLSQQAEFNEVRTLSTQRDVITDARQVSALTEIDWSAFYSEILPTLPAGTVIDSFVVESSSPIREFPVSTIPGQGARAAKITFAITSPNLESIAGWLVTLKAFPGYANATATPASKDAGGVYTSTITMNVTDSRFTKRFAPPEAVAPTEATTDTVEEEGSN